MEALLPPHVLHGDNDCNQLVAPFNTESEISHTARSSSDSRTDYDGNPLVTYEHAPPPLCVHVLHCHHALCSEVSSVHRCGAVPSHAMDPANAFTFHGAVGDGRALFGSTRGERPQANKAHLSSVPSPWALPGGGSDACAPAVDLAALMQLTAWIKALGELIRMQDGERLTAC